MFGKGGGPLAAWLKEFLQLVFLQTIQAFLYAIAIAMIVNISISSSIEKSDASISLGIICVVILTAIFKVEDLVKGVMGFGKTRADHGNAMASLMKTKMALDIGKRVLDNTKKIGSGVKGVLTAPAQRTKERLNYERRKKMIEGKYASDSGETGVNKGTEGEGGKPLGSGEKTDVPTRKGAAPAMSAHERDLRQRINTKKKELESGKLSKKQRDIKNSELRTLEADLASYKASHKTGETTADAAPASSPKTMKQSDRYKMEMELDDLKEKYDAKDKEIKKKQKEARRSIAKGFMETGGAIVGGVGGAIIAGADGDIQQAIQGTVAGMGVGDAIGEKMVDLATAPGDFLDSAVSEIKGAKKSYDKVVSGYQKEYEDMLSGVAKDMSDAEQDALKKFSKQAARTTAHVDLVSNRHITVTQKDIEHVVKKAKDSVRIKPTNTKRNIGDVGDID